MKIPELRDICRIYNIKQGKIIDFLTKKIKKYRCR